jgi:hypothetical protein
MLQHIREEQVTDPHSLEAFVHVEIEDADRVELLALAGVVPIENGPLTNLQQALDCVLLYFEV